MSVSEHLALALAGAPRLESDELASSLPCIKKKGVDGPLIPEV